MRAHKGTRASKGQKKLMSELEQKLRLGIGSAAAAAAIFAPIAYKWKGVLTFVATDAILTGIYGVSPLKKLIRS